MCTKKLHWWIAPEYISQAVCTICEPACGPDITRLRLKAPKMSIIMPPFWTLKLSSVSEERKKNHVQKWGSAKWIWGTEGVATSSC